MKSSAFAIFAIFALIQISVYGETDKKAAAAKAFVVSKMKEQLRTVPESLDVTLTDRANEFDPKIFKQMKQALDAAFELNKFSSTFEKTFSESVSPQALPGILQWYESALGKKISALEEQASSAEGTQQSYKYAETFQTNPPSEDVMEFAKGIDKAMNIAPLTLQMNLIFARAIANAREQFKPATKRASGTQIDQEVQKLKEQLESDSQDSAIFNSIFTYKSLLEFERRKYLTFLTSPDGKAFYDAVGKAYQVAFKDALGRVETEVKTVMAKSSKL